MVQKISTAFIGLLLLITVQLYGQENSPPDTIEYTADDNLGLFESNEIMGVTLRFDITRMMKEKPKDEYLDGSVTFYFDAADSLTQEIRIKSRGNRRYDLCSLPPLRLNFSTKGEDNKDVVKNMKLVTNCSKSSQYDNYLIKEYLAYRMYNVITDYSFRVRLLRIKYIDTGSRGINDTRFGFIIEPVELFEKRFNAKEVKAFVVRPSYVKDYSLDRLALFEYMIGNDDWYLEGSHNVKIFNFQGVLNVQVVPYDFDYSGFVNTHYAAPNDRHDIEFVTERIYMGPCRSEEEFRKVLEDFWSRKEDVLNIISSSGLMDEKRTKTAMKYIEGYFNEYKRDGILHKIMRECVDTKK